MSELALYRKYRSRQFSEVVGQQHVVATLEGALASGRISHAYLFTGPRGVGKTSVARLLAQAVNCLGAPISEPGSAAPEPGRPCRQCKHCVIPLPANLDVIEIDAASNRRIDEIRDLRDKIGLAPSLGKYKVYIIDEVHMLTTEAFNALLKTLEEPPAHAIFILATTEAHKLPDTIISRTQRFNFKPITTRDLQSPLMAIAKREKIPIDEEAIALLAAASQGGFRDAISMLDQVSSIDTDTIDAAAVRSVLGWSDTETIDQLSLAVAETNPAAVLAALDRSLEQGAQPEQIVLQLAERWRGFMLLAARGTSDGDATSRRVLECQSLAQIVASIKQLTGVVKSPWPALALESTLVGLCVPQFEVSDQASVEPKITTPASRVVAAEPTAPTTKSAAVEADPALWPKALLRIKADNNSLYSVLRSCRVTMGVGEVVIVCQFKFFSERLQEPKNRQIIESALKRVYNADVRVVCQLEAATATPAAPVEPHLNRDQELVSSALQIFGGEVVDG